MVFRQPQSSCLWESQLFHRNPVWPRDPEISSIISISRQHLHISSTADIKATFLSQGAFNKLYTITSSSLSTKYLFRVTLPIEPCIKTASEVATLHYLRRHTQIPVSKVITHDITSDNELGFEWILMEYLPGVCLRDIWPRFPGEKGNSIEVLSSNGALTCAPVDWKGKEEITRTISEYIQGLRKNPFKAIGSLYLHSDMDRFGAPTVETSNDPDFCLGPMVSLRLFYGGLRSKVDRNLGPYLSERDYISAWVNVQLQEVELAQTLDPEDPQYDEDLVDDGPDIKQAIEALHGVVDRLFSSETGGGRYFLRHSDLSLANILVDPGTFKITGIVDWECSGAAPKWEDAYPEFLYGPEVETEPQPWQEGDTDLARAELWESWEKKKLRRIFDATVLANKDIIKGEFVEHLSQVDTWHRKAAKWAQDIYILLENTEGNSPQHIQSLNDPV